MKKLFLALLLLPSLAVALTPAQNTAIKAVIDAARPGDSALNACITIGDDTCVAAWLNQPSTFIVWKTSVMRDEITSSATFDWTRVDNLTVGKARIWDMMFANQTQSINPANSNIRAGIDAAWVGTAADLAVRAAVYERCKRAATRAESALVTGTGATATPGLLTWEGSIDQTQIAGILGR